MKQIMGLKLWVNVPLNRFLQALSAAFWIYIFSLGTLFSLAFFMSIFLTSYWPLALLYLTWMYYDRETPFKGGPKHTIVKKFPLWKYFIDYFPIRLVKTAELNPEKNYLICYFPHGIFSAGVFGNFANNYSPAQTLFPGLNFRGSTLNMNFNVPFMRDIILRNGAISTSKESLLYVMDPKNKGNAVVLVVGGAAEAFYARPHTYHVVLKKRKGFVKIALKTGCSLVPTFSFGENDIYDQYYFKPGTVLYKLQMWFKNTTGMLPIIPKGRGLLLHSFGLVPHRSSITTVVGKPIDVPLTPNPTDEEVQHYHDLFTRALEELFNEHKMKYVSDPENTVLTIE